jgi:hypothetical protein
MAGIFFLYESFVRLRKQIEKNPRNQALWSLQAAAF